jgi:TrwC relaxase
MRATTLKATAAKLPGLHAYYAGLAEDREPWGPVDCYLDPDEPPGRWSGRGRHPLGLDCEVDGADLRSLLEAAHPGTCARLGRRFGTRRPGVRRHVLGADVGVGPVGAVAGSFRWGRGLALTMQRSTPRSPGSSGTVR